MTLVSPWKKNPKKNAIEEHLELQSLEAVYGIPSTTGISSLCRIYRRNEADFPYTPKTPRYEAHMHMLFYPHVEAKSRKEDAT